MKKIYEVAARLIVFGAMLMVIVLALRLGRFSVADLAPIDPALMLDATIVFLGIGMIALGIHLYRATASR